MNNPVVKLRTILNHVSNFLFGLLTLEFLQKVGNLKPLCPHIIKDIDLDIYFHTILSSKKR